VADGSRRQGAVSGRCSGTQKPVAPAANAFRPAAQEHRQHHVVRLGQAAGLLEASSPTRSKSDRHLKQRPRPDGGQPCGEGGLQCPSSLDFRATSATRMVPSDQNGWPRSPRVRLMEVTTASAAVNSLKLKADQKHNFPGFLLHDFAITPNWGVVPA